MFKVGSNVVIYFNDEKAPPYRMFGIFIEESDTYVTVKGTVGDYMNKEYVIPRNVIKMIEVQERGN